ncbi:hypothetical protein [Nostoc sp. ChiQUE01b]|uniref:hypothetical protein n=1 Tax=Nostoc sp. ChiQUE01b TaxID=3075376 RepID=UPI002AD1E7A2|nr:hypothetical protein [Nostoc sp. ChiQUE01b]MDZ8257663.1 hypothetical protein [Nostoc sp. ChiQUE01b]
MAIEKQSISPSASLRDATRTLRANRSGNAIENLPLLLEPPGADDERAELTEEEVQAEEDTQVTVATAQAASFGLSCRELEILEEMTDVANQTRYQADPRVEKLVVWIKQNLCTNLGKANAAWLEKRVIIFTEYTDTKRYLQRGDARNYNL